MFMQVYRAGFFGAIKITGPAIEKKRVSSIQAFFMHSGGALAHDIFALHYSREPFFPNP